MEKTFEDVVNFHRHLCLDIAMGYRIAKTGMREMASEARNLKSLVAIVENETCAVDALQEFTGCTLGKRNLVMTGTGKPVYILLNTQTGKGVRIYCKYWETFDQDGSFHKRRKKAASPEATQEERLTFERELNTKIKEILRAPEDQLFSVKRVSLAPPPKVGKYQAEPCGRCGEHTHVGRLIDAEGQKICKDCQEELSAKPA